jgi:hypothetical protein
MSTENSPATATTHQNPAGQSSSDMLQMLNAFLTVQALHVAAELGIADQLMDGPRTVHELANVTRADHSSLYRLLRMLTGHDVFREEADGRFALTALGSTLRSEGPNSVRDWALFVGAPEMWEVWGRLRDSVMTGRAAFPSVHGLPMWEYMAERPNIGDAFNRWMTRQSNQHNSALVASYDFAPFRTLVDVGGGQGSTLAAILQSQPSLRGILLDLPAVVAHPAPLVEAGVASRCEIVGDDMLRKVPAADAYLIKRVLMDWGDEQAATILRNCAAAMSEAGKVLVVEMLLAPGNDPSPSRSFDLLMLLNQPGGRIRTESELRALFTIAGLRLTRVIPTSSPNCILEGEALVGT